MALIKYGPIASEVRGSIGGTVFTRSRAGAIVKQKTKPVFNPTPRRLEHLNNLALIRTSWIKESDAKRILWNTLGDNTDWTNALGETYHPSGYNLYIRQQALSLMYWGYIILDGTPPAVADIANPDVSYRFDSGKFQAKLNVEQHTNDTIHFWLCPKLLFTVYYYAGPYIHRADFRQLAMFNTWTDVFTSAHGVAVGNRYSIRARVRNFEYKVSTPILTIMDYTA